MLLSMADRPRDASIEKMDPSPNKRHVSRSDTKSTSNSNLNTKNKEVKPIVQHTMATIARQQSIDHIMQMRFRRALKRNDARQLITCVDSGYTPTLMQWMHIIGKIHVSTAIQLVDVIRHLEPQCCAIAIRRQHKKLFKAVMQRIDQVPESQMENLMAVPAYYLGVCLDKGLNPNIRLKNKRLPLEHACAHSRIAHIEMLLKDTRTIVSQNVCRFLIRQSKQQRFAKRAIELCKDIGPDMVLEAVVANVTPALLAIMQIIEPKYEDHEAWSDFTHMMMCPILNDYTTDIVKTPINNHYYDRTSILTWVREKGTDPLTREDLRETDLLLRSEFLKDYARELQSHIKKLLA